MYWNVLKRLSSAIDTILILETDAVVLIKCREADELLPYRSRG